MAFDFKKLLTHADTILQVAGMARDQIAERINHDLELQLEEARLEISRLRSRLADSEAELARMRSRNDEGPQ